MNIFGSSIRTAIAAVTLIGSSSSHADKQPEFELGLGLGGIYQNYYLGTSDSRQFAFPVIIPIYRGETLKADEEGARAQIFKDNRYKLDLSAEFGLEFDSDDIRLREGMPDIDNVLQLGPSLQITLEKQPFSEWRLRLPVRASATIGSDFGYTGLTFSPDITYLRDMPFAGSYWRLGLSVGPLFGTADYHDVYYGVADAFATPERPAYDPDGGLTGTRFLATFTSKNSRRITSWFLRYENLSGAVIEDSPLVEQEYGLTVGFIYSYLFFKSKVMVDVD